VSRDAERILIDFPGFLRSAEGGYIKIEDFLSFVAGASQGKGDTKDRAMAWLRKQGVSGPIDHLSPADVSRLTAAAQKVIAAKHGARPSRWSVRWHARPPTTARTQ